MRKSFMIPILAIYGALIMFIFAGFLYAPMGFHYSPKFCAALITLFLILLASPIGLYFYRKALGHKGVTYSLLPCLSLMIILYLVFMMRFYYIRKCPFDPFLQNRAPTLAGTILPKGKDVCRLLFLGGSTTEGPYLSEVQRFPNLCQKMLQDRYPVLRVEIFNAAMSSYTTKHSLIHYVTYCSDWQPDIVIVMHAINDLYRSFEPPAHTLGKYNNEWSHFYGHAIQGADPTSYESYLCHKYLGKFSSVWYARLRYRAVDFPLERYRSLKQFENNLHKIVRAVRNDSAAVILLTEPYLYKEVMSDAELAILGFGKTYCYTQINLWRREYPNTKSMLLAMRAYNEAVKRVAITEGAIFADADGRVPKQRSNFLDDVHFTYPASDSVARCIADAVMSSGVIEKRFPGVARSTP